MNSQVVCVLIFSKLFFQPNNLKYRDREWRMKRKGFYFGHMQFPERHLKDFFKFGKYVVNAFPRV